MKTTTKQVLVIVAALSVYEITGSYAIGGIAILLTLPVLAWLESKATIEPARVPPKLVKGRRWMGGGRRDGNG